MPHRLNLRSAIYPVADLNAEWAQLLAQGGTELSAPRDVGGGVHVAEVRDPFGNAIGLIEERGA